MGIVLDEIIVLKIDVWNPHGFYRFRSDVTKRNLSKVFVRLVPTKDLPHTIKVRMQRSEAVTCIVGKLEKGKRDQLKTRKTNCRT